MVSIIYGAHFVTNQDDSQMNQANGTVTSKTISYLGLSPLKCLKKEMFIMLG